MESNVLDGKTIINKGIFNNIDIMENTLESFEKAFNKNFILRCKIQALKDETLIIFEDNTLERLLNIKDELKYTTYEEIEYISKYKIPTLNDLLNILNNNILILEIPNFSKKILKKFLIQTKNLSNQIIIESDNIKTLKLFKKYNFRICLRINNKRLINTIFTPDYLNIPINLFDKKTLKKLKEKYYIIGSVIKNEQILIENKSDFNNLIIEVNE